MMRKSQFKGGMNENSTVTTTISSWFKEEEIDWEKRPGGMLVQKRCEKSFVSDSNLRLRIAYGSFRYEISINSRATFGELKKMLSGETGLQPGEQRIIFRGKERENSEYLDICGIKDRSKVVLTEDPSSREKRYIEMRKNAKIQSAQRAISSVSFEVDKLAEQVSVIENSISKGSKVPEVQITTLIEMLMRQAVKLDSISAEGDVSSQKNLQGKRVQKCVETLDVLKISNARVKPVVVPTKWETFEPPTPTQWEFFD